MENTIISQLYLLLIFFICGICIGIFFDIFRILRKSFKTSDIITHVEDIIFWIFTGIFFLFTLFKFNNGEIRSYVIIGIILGIIIYLLIISKYFIKINIIIINYIKKLIHYIIKIIFKVIKPFSFIVINIRKSITSLYKKTTKLLKNNQKNRCNKKDFEN